MSRRALALLPCFLACAAPVPMRLPAPTVATPTTLQTPGPPSTPALDAAAAGVEPAALARLDADAARSHSDAMVLWKDGRVLLDRRYTPEGEQPIETMSITKSVSALAIAMLVEDQRLESFEVPLTRFFPEWNQGKKKRITLLHVLRHTSGLQDTDDTSEIWQSPDFVQLALAAELESEPGTRFHYNNKAANLLGEVVRRACGERLDHFLARRLFAPLGVERYEWLRDPSGHPLVQSGLKLNARDLAQIGEMLRLRGTVNGKSILRSASIDRLTRADSPHERRGLFFWIPDSGRGFVARGYLGQRLLVLPEHGVVAVRLRHWTAEARPGADDFEDFEHRVEQLFAGR